MIPPLVRSSSVIFTMTMALVMTTTLLCHNEKVSALSISSSKIQSTTRGEGEGLSTMSRRDALLKGFGVMAGVTATAAFGLGSIPSPAVAAGGTPPTKEELERIKIGYKQIQYLLDNFEQETTTCRENGGECKRDAEPIRRALGLRSTTDPLFQIEKVFNKVKYMDGDVDLETFFEASEDWNSAMTLSNSMAFISQFGEYNPGGGKDEVLKYLNESKKQVESAERSLKRIMDAINLEP